MKLRFLITFSFISINLIASPKKSYRPKPTPPGHKNLKYISSNLCELAISVEDYDTLKKYFTTKRSFTRIKTVLEFIKKEKISCPSQKSVYYHYPIELVKYNFSDGKKIYISYKYDAEYKITDSYAQARKVNLLIKEKMIPMRDGNHLSTYIFAHEDEEPRGTILIRTPYYKDFASYFTYSYPTEFGYNVVIQSNRGTHRSTGDFIWLSNQNINDGHDTINWLTKQPFSNGKVIARGVSYDGFNALALGVNPPKALKGIVVCSAPSNALTDSFIYNSIAETRFLNFIWGRESINGDLNIEDFKQKTYFLRKSGTSRSKWDNIIFGRNIKDWEEFNKNKSKYWKKRSLLPYLKNIKVPILHVAGLKKDQDARDVFLSFSHVNKMKNHRLILHNKGHGCGDLTDGEEFKQYFQLASDDPKDIVGPKVRQYSIKQKKYIESNHFPIKEIKSLILDFPILNDNKDYLAEILDAPDFTFEKSPYVEFEFKIEKDIAINGSPKIKMVFSSTAPKSVLYIDFFIKDENEKIINVIRPPQRTGIIFYKKPGEIQTSILTVPPLLAKVSKESKILVRAYTWNKDFITPVSIERNQFFLKNKEAQLTIHKKTKLLLPLEK